MIIMGALAVLAAVLGFGIALYRGDRYIAGQSLRAGLGLGVMILGGLLALRGMSVIGVPLFATGLGLLGAIGKTHKRQHSAGTSRQSTQMTRVEAAAILGVRADADPEAVRAAYLKLIKKVHPDQGGSDVLARQVQSAYEVLKDQVKD
ncbi:J domain-containing protein [Woodsholea maritima]|uniref:J domain-containing protein n=1 Tax=Woodsholea maritima TaxID=240237 RepID=UPI00036C028F|nr:J domain-containing protein [Woodsholea maritima]